MTNIDPENCLWSSWSLTVKTHNAKIAVHGLEYHRKSPSASPWSGTPTYINVVNTPKQDEGKERLADDWQPRSNSTKLFESGDPSLGRWNKDCRVCWKVLRENGVYEGQYQASNQFEVCRRNQSKEESRRHGSQEREICPSVTVSNLVIHCGGAPWQGIRY